MNGKITGALVADALIPFLGYPACKQRYDKYGAVDQNPNMELMSFLKKTCETGTTPIILMLIQQTSDLFVCQP
jgi:hypothetical protein